MSGHGLVVQTAAELVALTLALGITLVSYRTYREAGTATYRAALVGFALLAAGLVVESLLIRVGGLALTTVHTAEAVLFALGFGSLYLSLR